MVQPGTVRTVVTNPLFAYQWLERHVALILERCGRRGRKENRRQAPSVGNTVAALHGMQVLNMCFYTWHLFGADGDWHLHPILPM